MITLENRFFPVRSAVCFVIEGGIILFSVVLSYELLNHSGIATLLDVRDALVRGAIVAFICQGCMYFLDLYDLKMSQSAPELVFSILIAAGFVCVGIGGFSLLVPELGVDGHLYYVTIAFTTVFLFIWRLLFDVYLTRFSPRENVLIVGSGGIVPELAAEIRAREKMGFRLVGFVDLPENRRAASPAETPCLGSFENLQGIVRDKGVRRVVIALAERRGGYPVKSLLNLRASGVRVVEWPEFFEKLSGRIPIDTLAPSYFIFSEGFRKPWLMLFLRRVISAAVAAAALVLLLPLFLLVAIMIKADSRGAVFYTQLRVGQKGRIFRIYKFRSMRADAEKGGEPRWASKADPRVTRVGRIIRVSRIDELPQLLNVLKGDIDLVGPRPERPEFVAQLQEMIPYYTLRHTVKPGLTGWAQVMFMYCGTVEESKEKLQYDLFYIKNMSIKLDLLILFRTLKIVLLGRGAR